MKPYFRDQKLICVAMLVALSACSDSTQFTERTISSGFNSPDAEVQSGQLAEDEQRGLSADADAEASQASELPSDLNTADTSDLGDPLSPVEKPVTPPGPGTDTPTQNEEVFKPETQSLFSLCADKPQNSIVAQVYPLKVDTRNLPNFASIKPVGEDICLEQLNISKRAFTEGFPMVEDLIEWFGLDIKFKVEVPASGNYTFTLSSDDGSLLFIDGNSVIDNDGLHPVQEKSAAVYLSKGSHVVQIKYFQGPRYHIALELFWKVPGASARTYIPTSLISRP